MTDDVRALVEDLFRRSSGRLVARLVRTLGPAQLQLAEDAVQDALIRALQRWPFTGLPEAPEAWLFRTARNRALDRLRRSARWESELPEEEVRGRVDALERMAVAPPSSTAPGTPLDDDELALLFLCAHPELPTDGSVALTLRTVGGLSTREIAAAFLVPESTMAQRIVRAKRTFARLDEPVRMPGPSELPARLDRVIAVLYLMFNEGYAATEDASWVRVELCRESIRLAEILARHPATTGPRVDALLALFLLQGSRLPARTVGGSLVPFEAQDRSLWDRGWIDRGFQHLERALSGEPTALHIEAAIAGSYASAPDFESVGWDEVVHLHDVLRSLRPSPIIELNRAVAVAMKDGVPAGLRALEPLEALEGSRLPGWAVPATRGWMLDRCGGGASAREAWATAADRATSPVVERWCRARAAAHA